MMPTVLQQHISEFTLTLCAHQQQAEPGIIERICASSRISPQLALDIYRNNTRGARINALELVYPACKCILGNDTFRSIAQEFVIADSIGTSDLNRYGETFNQHLDVLLSSGRLPSEYAYLPHLASLECKYHAAYYADSDPAFDFELFKHKINSGHPVNLRISHSLGLLATRYPLYAIWQHNHPAPGTEPNKSRLGHEVQSIAGMQYLLVFRQKYTPVIEIISEHEYRLLEAFDNNLSLQAIVERIECDIDVLLPKLIANKWVVAINDNE